MVRAHVFSSADAEEAEVCSATRHADGNAALVSLFWC